MPHPGIEAQVRRSATFMQLGAALRGNRGLSPDRLTLLPVGKMIKYKDDDTN